MSRTRAAKDKAFSKSMYQQQITCRQRTLFSDGQQQTGHWTSLRTISDPTTSTGTSINIFVRGVGVGLTHTENLMIKKAQGSEGNKRIGTGGKKNQSLP